MTTVGTRTGNFELVQYDGRKLSRCQTNPSFTSYVKDLIFIQRIIKKIKKIMEHFKHNQICILKSPPTSE